MRAIARPPMTTADVGVMRLISPLPVWYAVTTRNSGTPAKPASGAMIGMATVARPDDEGMRNDSGRKSPNIRLMNSTPPRPATACSAALRTVSVISPLFMTTVMPARDADDQRDAEQVARAIHERGGQLALLHPRDHADEDREQEERGGHLGEPPPQGRDGDPEVLPRDDAVDHHREGEEEQGEHRLLPPRERRVRLRRPRRRPGRRPRFRPSGRTPATSSGRP